MRFFIPFAVVPIAAAQRVGCIDESGGAVDWWVLSKHPDGASYSLITSKNKEWVSGPKPVTDTDSVLGKQMARIYDRSVPNYLFYNDQHPGGAWSATYGHSKGFFAYDSVSAFWVQHSIPDFPMYIQNGYHYGHSQEREGQHAICMSLSLDNLNTIAGVMRYSNGWVYNHSVGRSPSLGNVSLVATGQNVSGTVIQDVETAWGHLRLFGKSVSFYNDMANALISPNLQQSFYSQSWLNGGGPLGDFCPASGYDVIDALYIKELPASTTHTTKHDHSKWLVSKDLRPFFCGLDNNHVHSQYHRSGLAVCFQDHGLRKAMLDTVASAGSCNPTPAPSPGPPGPAGPCGGSGVHWNECKEDGCTYVHARDTKKCGVDHYGCYATSSLPSGCPTDFFV